ncbi:MAG TPA: hypothetical protein DCG69_11900 [Bacteroidales bacterium]|nr:hypothetical protein [Bacteroidales bacterium]
MQNSLVFQMFNQLNENGIGWVQSLLNRFFCKGAYRKIQLKNIGTDNSQISKSHVFLNFDFENAHQLAGGLLAMMGSAKEVHI